MKTLDDVVREIAPDVLGKPPIGQAYSIYKWVVQNIEYDRERKEAIENGEYLEIMFPEETIDRGKGVCCDQSVLYVALCRRFGLEAYYAEVDVDNRGKDYRVEKVGHSCAVVKLPERSIHVDIANQLFDAQHKQVRLVELNVLQEVGKMGQMLEDKMEKVGRALLKLFVATGISASLYVGVNYFINYGKYDNIKTAVMENRTKFITDNGVIEFYVAECAKEDMQSAIFYAEARHGKMPPHRLLDLYVSADNQPADNVISTQEAKNALEKARQEYVKNKH